MHLQPKIVIVKEDIYKAAAHIEFGHGAIQLGKMEITVDAPRS